MLVIVLCSVRDPGKEKQSRKPGLGNEPAAGSVPGGCAGAAGLGGDGAGRKGARRRGDTSPSLYRGFLLVIESLKEVGFERGVTEQCCTASPCRGGDR